MRPQELHWVLASLFLLILFFRNFGALGSSSPGSTGVEGIGIRGDFFSVLPFLPNTFSTSGLISSTCSFSEFSPWSSQRLSWFRKESDVAKDLLQERQMCLRLPLWYIWRWTSRAAGDRKVDGHPKCVQRNGRLLVPLSQILRCLAIFLKKRLGWKEDNDQFKSRIQIKKLGIQRPVELVTYATRRIRPQERQGSILSILLSFVPVLFTFFIGAGPNTSSSGTSNLYSTLPSHTSRCFDKFLWRIKRTKWTQTNDLIAGVTHAVTWTRPQIGHLLLWRNFEFDSFSSGVFTVSFEAAWGGRRASVDNSDDCLRKIKHKTGFLIKIDTKFWTAREFWEVRNDWISKPTYPGSWTFSENEVTFLFWIFVTARRDLRLCFFFLGKHVLRCLARLLWKSINRVSKVSRLIKAKITHVFSMETPQDGHNFWVRFGVLDPHFTRRDLVLLKEETPSFQPVFWASWGVDVEGTVSVFWFFIFWSSDSVLAGMSDSVGADSDWLCFKTSKFLQKMKWRFSELVKKRKTLKSHDVWISNVQTLNKTSNRWSPV